MKVDTKKLLLLFARACYAFTSYRKIFHITKCVGVTGNLRAWHPLHE